MFALLPQSPARVGAVPIAVPRISMSRKSQSAATNVPTVRSRCVPIVLDAKNIRRTADAPAQVNVPLIVWLAPKNTLKIFPFGKESVKFVKVFTPLIVNSKFVVTTFE